MVGETYHRKAPPNYLAECVVMAEVDGWVMARFEGCQPFVVSLETFLTEFAHTSPAGGIVPGREVKK